MKFTNGHYLSLLLGALAAGVQSIEPQLSGSALLIAQICVGAIASVALPLLAGITPSALPVAGITVEKTK